MSYFCILSGVKYALASAESSCFVEADGVDGEGEGVEAGEGTGEAGGL